MTVETDRQEASSVCACDMVRFQYVACNLCYDKCTYGPHSTTGSNATNDTTQNDRQLLHAHVVVMQLTY